MKQRFQKKREMFLSFCGRVAKVPKVYPHCIFTELLLCALALVGIRGGSTR